MRAKQVSNVVVIRPVSNYCGPHGGLFPRNLPKSLSGLVDQRGWTRTIASINELKLRMFAIQVITLLTFLLAVPGTCLLVACYLSETGKDSLENTLPVLLIAACLFYLTAAPLAVVFYGRCIDAIFEHVEDMNDFLWDGALKYGLKREEDDVEGGGRTRTCFGTSSNLCPCEFWLSKLRACCGSRHTRAHEAMYCLLISFDQYVPPNESESSGDEAATRAAERREAEWRKMEQPLLAHQQEIMRGYSTSAGPAGQSKGRQSRVARDRDRERGETEKGGRGGETKRDRGRRDKDKQDFEKEKENDRDRDRSRHTRRADEAAGGPNFPAPSTRHGEDRRAPPSPDSQDTRDRLREQRRRDRERRRRMRDTDPSQDPMGEVEEGTREREDGRGARQDRDRDRERDRQREGRRTTTRQSPSRTHRRPPPPSNSSDSDDEDGQGAVGRRMEEGRGRGQRAAEQGGEEEYRGGGRSTHRSGVRGGRH
uniref:Uncharacterized protein n=1 Tax=Chromera velia CCMP2878 TaxID=1169474 RepID=A0A0G4I3T1_9ALVE|eukprot:Cvel_10681.t1-p1 / transcript=Cvel_10681.t1 / gene=Cvel_10681 / organism=Chromera_velia_CCMP2878 / gene_product=hypothetical protein / transcript_product=hypothetical protein / location=Cvel_scaffold649:37598-39533(+) / protein_length=480 / sequence_SO=supercontig / SO=protein_coding / is_pseudo=false